MREKLKNISGVTLIELLIGIVITTIIMGAMYTTYNVVNKTYSQVSEKVSISKSSRDLISMIMRDVRMAGFRYYAGTSEINKYQTEANAKCTDGNSIVLPKTSYLDINNGYDDAFKSTNPIVIRKKSLGNYKIPRHAGGADTDTEGWSPEDTCCDSIEIVYEDFNQNSLKQPFKKYRITYFAEKSGNTNNQRYAVYKSVETYYQARDESICQWPLFGTGEWINDKARCPECIEKEMIRDYVIDMEFDPFDENGLIIQDVSGKYPLPDVAGTDADGSDIRLMFSKIRGVDIRITFTSKENFFTATSQKKRKPRGLLSDRKGSDQTTTDVSTQSGVETQSGGFDTQAGDDSLKLIDSVLVTVNTRNVGKGFF